ncbi:MAG TPA: hypothetical protein VG028_01405 [Terriglobia bacterium]|nr:hypothetical protein [Terriglobia bacterium]
MVKRVLLSIGLLALSVSSARAAKNSVPAGSVIHCRLTQTLSTFMNAPGDPFTANVSEPVILDGHEVIPVGAKIEGRIAQLQRPGRIRGVGQMRLTAEKVVMPDGASYPLSAILAAVYGAEAKVHGEEGGVKGPNSRLRTVEEVGAGMGGGGLVGTLFGGFTGTLVGGAIGGAAGFVDTMRKRGPDLALPVGTQLNYQLTRDLDVDVQTATERINKTGAEVVETPVK